MKNSISFNNVNVVITPADGQSLSPSSPSTPASRLAQLQAAGIPTDSFVSLSPQPTATAPVPSASPEGSPAPAPSASPEDSLATAPSASPEGSSPLTPEEQTIIENGYIRNTRLHRRYLAKQFWDMLHADGGFTANLREHGFEYSLRTTLEELHVLSKLSHLDQECFAERRRFLPCAYVVGIMDDAIKALEDNISTLRIRHCRGREYIHIASQDIFLDEVEAKVLQPLRTLADKARHKRKYHNLYLIFKEFVHIFPNVPASLPQSPLFVDFYKGNGAFYFLKNIILFHDVHLTPTVELTASTVSPSAQPLSTIDSMNYLNQKVDAYIQANTSPGDPRTLWQLFGYCKQVIQDTAFDLVDRLRQLGVPGYTLTDD